MLLVVSAKGEAKAVTCPQGHVYDVVGFNMIKDPRGGQYRRCKRCHADRANAARAKLASTREPGCAVARPRAVRAPQIKSPMPAAPVVDLRRFAALAAEVQGRLKIVCWDLSDQATVGRLYDGIEPDDTVHVFSDEWASRCEQVTCFVRARAGIFERRMGARMCEVRDVPRHEATPFLETHHIQGPNNLGVACFGLYMGGELLGVLSLGRHSRQISGNKIVLDRLCFKAGVQVVGGASRLVSAAIKWSTEQNYDELVTFSDNRLTDRALYEQVGFSLEQNQKPDYCYVQFGKRLSKQSQKKGTVDCPDSMTEFEWAAARGLKRIFDAGKKRWVINLKPNEHRSRNELSAERCAKQHGAGVFTHAHIRGHFESAKNGRHVYFGSSYELRCLFLLESDSAVTSFRRCDAFKGQDGWRNPDLWVEFAHGAAEVWEIKPSVMLTSLAVQNQVRESELFAKANSAGFRVWTEQDSGLRNDHEIVSWAINYLDSKNSNSSLAERKKEGRKRIRCRHYERRIASERVEVWCDYCKKTHTPLRLTHDKNLKRNGIYVCERYGGHLAGKRPKDHLRKENPYAVDGKKQCTACIEVKPVELFGVRRASRDGLAFRCKECARSVAKNEVLETERGSL